MSAEPAIRIDKLVKRYAPAKGAKGRDFRGQAGARRGQFRCAARIGSFGLLGPNGAGKIDR